VIQILAKIFGNIGGNNVAFDIMEAEATSENLRVEWYEDKRLGASCDEKFELDPLCVNEDFEQGLDQVDTGAFIEPIYHHDRCPDLIREGTAWM
jgi:hypothetical protein